MQSASKAKTCVLWQIDGSVSFHSSSTFYFQSPVAGTANHQRNKGCPISPSTSVQQNKFKTTVSNQPVTTTIVTVWAVVVNWKQWKQHWIRRKEIHVSFQLCLSLDIWVWKSKLSCLSLSFLICKLKMITSTLKGWWDTQRKNACGNSQMQSAWDN